MESFLKVLRIVFADHWMALLLLSVSWILIFGVFKVADIILTKIFFELPFSLWIRLRRTTIGITRARAALMHAQSPISDLDIIADQLSTLYASVDNLISRITRGEYLLSRLVTGRALKGAVQNISTTHWALLESDLALCRALSQEPSKMERGLLSFIGNPRTLHREALRLLFYELRNAKNCTQNDPEILNTLVFHLKRSIENKTELEELRTIASELATPEQDIVKEATTEIEQKLSFTAGASH